MLSFPRITQLVQKKMALSPLVLLPLAAQSCGTISNVSQPEHIYGVPQAGDEMPASSLAITSNMTLKEVSLEKKVQSKFRTKHALRGEASWYGPGFHGKKTASGDIYNQNKLTAAHKTLPLGSKARVTNLDNGKTVEVEINDRGPYVEGRIIDLSRAAAGVLGFVETGTVPVTIELIADPPRTLLAEDATWDGP